MIQTERQLNLSYERYVDRLHDDYYGEPALCLKCEEPVEWEGDSFESWYNCGECGDYFGVGG
jgi:hypothetical protein